MLLSWREVTALAYVIFRTEVSQSMAIRAQPAQYFLYKGSRLGEFRTQERRCSEDTSLFLFSVVRFALFVFCRGEFLGSARSRRRRTRVEKNTCFDATNERQLNVRAMFYIKIKKSQDNE